MSECITWHVDVPPNTTVHVESSSQEVETCIVPTPEYDGKLASRVDGDFDARVWLDSRYVRLECFNQHVVLDIQQALSLLDWLSQEKATLEKLAKEQAK